MMVKYGSDPTPNIYNQIPQTVQIVEVILVAFVDDHW